MLPLIFSSNVCPLVLSSFDVQFITKKKENVKKKKK